jgi:uncharacterized protein (DUF302 family)
VTAQGIVERPSRHSVDATVDRIEGILRAKGITLFALIDHGGEAAKVGMRMPPTKLLVFGKPEAGTPLMQAEPRLAIDLPLKILVWQDAAGQVWVTTNSAEFLRERYGLAPEQRATLAVADAIAAEAALGE